MLYQFPGDALLDRANRAFGQFHGVAACAQPETQARIFRTLCRSEVNEVRPPVARHAHVPVQAQILPRLAVPGQCKLNVPGTVCSGLEREPTGFRFDLVPRADGLDMPGRPVGFQDPHPDPVPVESGRCQTRPCGRMNVELKAPAGAGGEAQQAHGHRPEGSVQLLHVRAEISQEENQLQAGQDHEPRPLQGELDRQNQRKPRLVKEIVRQRQIGPAMFVRRSPVPPSPPHDDFRQLKSNVGG